MNERGHLLYIIRGVVFITAFIFYIIDLVFPTKLVEVCLNTTAILLFVSALIGVSRFYFVLSVSFLVSSLFLTYYYHGLWSQIAEGFSLMLKLILFIGMIPLISVPVDDQIGMIQKLIKVLNQKVSSFKVCHISSFLLANFINMAALPISKSIFYHKGTEPAETVNAQLSFRSFGLAMMCSPIGAAIALAVDISGTTWLSLLSINLCLVAIGLWLSFFFTKKDRLRSEQNKLSQQIQLENQDYLSLLTIFLPFCVYFSFLLISERFFSTGMMETILFSVLPFTFFWSIGIKKLISWWNACRVQIFKITPSFFGQFSVIITAGLFLHTVEALGLSQSLVRFLPGLGTDYSAIFYIPAIIVIVLSLSMLGVHQFVAMIFVGQILKPEAIGVSPAIYASALLVGFATGMLGSSFSGASITMSSLLPGTTSYQIAKRNYPFSFTFIAISMLFLILVHYLM